MIISSIIPVVIVSVIAHSLLSHRLLQVQKSNMIKAAELNRTGLEAMIETHKTEISMLSYDNNLITLVNENNSVNTDLISNVNSILQERKEVNPYCSVLKLYNKDRFVIGSSD